MNKGADSSGLIPAQGQASPVCVALFSVVSAILMTAPAFAADAQSSAPKAKITLETPLSPFQPKLEKSTNFSFTVPGAASARAQTEGRAFRFTPSGRSDDSKAFSLGVAARTLAPMPSARTLSAAPETIVAGRAYNVDVSVAWKGFSLNTGYTHSDTAAQSTPLASTRDAVDVGLSYGGKNWRTGLQGTAEERSVLAFTPLERRYSVALGGAYMVAPRLSVTGGVRYKLPPEQPSLLDADRGDQSVYVGTNIAF
ncbi:MAG: hypothetical protein ACMVO5_09850 [Polymorphobacter sp.]|uniref:hypothetical protein n=1 Tax=Polymorphobacter sp. TaxID=1909290 RepID=UPI003A88F556